MLIWDSVWNIPENSTRYCNFQQQFYRKLLLLLLVAGRDGKEELRPDSYRVG